MKIAIFSLTALLPLTLLACDRTGPTAPPETQGAAQSPSTGGNMPQDQHHGHSPSGSNPHAGVPSGHPTAGGSHQQPDDPTVAAFLGLEAPKPASWQWQPPRNAMITTNYTVPAPADVENARAAHLNVYFFGEGMGGPIQDNVDRWKNQFRSADGYEVEPIVDEFEIDSMPVTFVELEGEWMQMGASWYTPNQLFLAAIIDAPAGRIFIRFAGDQKTIEHNRDSFMEMVHGLRRVDGAEVDDPGAPYGTGHGSGYESGYDSGYNSGTGGY